MAERYDHKQIETWWNQMPTLQYAMKKMLEAFKTHITPALSMLLFTKPKDQKKSWTEHFLYLVAVAEVSGGDAEYMVLQNIVQYASEDMRVVLMAKVDAHRTNYLQQAKELAQTTQAWESGTRKVLPKGEISHLRAMCQNRSNKVAKDQSNFTLAISDHDAEDAHAVCIQPNEVELNISKVGNVTLRLSAAGETKSVKLTEVYFAVGLAHNLISYGKLDAKGVIFDVELSNRVLTIKTAVRCKLQRPRGVILVALANNAGPNEVITHEA
uniref:Uncharacterized protein AlNc14C372G11117 n=1 Tax=Albugo laibachii Nc14 TaxID=890382 RepID=F0WY57_9STRA|nr:conserved hypothetical protein [Albugo laibachii Nc14]|eukprot:CCA26408.1 conserved hypothetical protein [Albugo laibachii Nc14]